MRSSCWAGRGTSRSRRTIGRNCWARSATRWSAASGRACRASWSTALARPVTDAAALDRLRVTASTCTRCPLAEGRTQVVFGVGSAEAELLFVGEGPGREEDLAGEPFVGRSGKLLDRLMAEEIGLTRAQCYIANVVKCRPPNNRDPLPGEIEACRPYLEEQIALIEPAVIVTLGNFATRLLLDSTEGIRHLRGRVFPSGTGHLVPTYHPAYALRAGGEAVAEMRADL